MQEKSEEEKKRGEEGLKHGSTAGDPDGRTGDGSTACRDATTPTDPGERFPPVVGALPRVTSEAGSQSRVSCYMLINHYRTILYRRNA